MEEGVEIDPMVMFPTLLVADMGASVGWCSEVLGFGTVFVLLGSGGEPVLAQRRWGRRCVSGQGWSEAYWVQPRNEAGRAWRMSMTSAWQEWQTGGVALQDGLVQRDERPAMTRKPRRQR